MATQRAKRAAKIALENPNKPMKEVMMEAGYSESTALRPGRNLTESHSWQELMEQYLPDKHLTEKHREFLDAKTVVTRYQRGEIVDEYEQTDPVAIKALDMAYKLKKRYGDVNIDKALIVNLSSETANKYAIKPTPESDSK